MELKFPIAHFMGDDTKWSGDVTVRTITSENRDQLIIMMAKQATDTTDNLKKNRKLINAFKEQSFIACNLNHPELQGGDVAVTTFDDLESVGFDVVTALSLRMVMGFLSPMRSKGTSDKQPESLTTERISPNN